ASGVRRIEALAGPAARTWLLEKRAALEGVLAALQTPADKAIDAVHKLRDELASLRKASAQASRQGLEAELVQLAAGATRAAGGGSARAACAGLEGSGWLGGCVGGATPPRSVRPPTSCVARWGAARRCWRSSPTASSRSWPRSPTISWRRRSCAPMSWCAR